MFKKRNYFRDFLEAGEGISTNILSDRLLRLEEANIISKSQDPEHGKRYIYRLTKKGISLVPVMLELMKWAAEFDEDTEMPKSFVKRLRKDSNKLAEEVSSKLRAAE